MSKVSSKKTTQASKRKSKKSSAEARATFKRNLRRSIYVCGATLMLASAAVPSGVALADTINQPQTTRQARAGLADISLLTGGQMSTNKANPQTKNAQGNYDLDLSYTGTGVADIGLATRKVMVFGLAPELRGKVVGGATIDVNAALTDLDLSKIPGVSAQVGLVHTALSALELTGIHLDAVQNALTQLTSAQPLGTYSTTVAGNVSNDRITADVTDGLGNYAKAQAQQVTTGLIQDLQASLAGLPNNLVYASLRGALQTLLNILNPLLSTSADVLNNLLNVNLLGHTTARLHTTVSQPTAANTNVYGILANNGAVDIDLLSASGDRVPLVFDMTAENPIADYVVNQPTVNTATAGDTSISGNVAITQPVPDGTTFKAIVTMPDSTTKEAPVTVNGSTGTFTVATGTLNANDALSVKIQAVNGSNTKDGNPTSVTVQAGQPTNPIENYNVATPTLNPATAGDTSVSGNATLTTPIPDGTTFKAIATLPGGGTATSDVTVDGNHAEFTVETGELTAGQQVSVKLQAVNGSNTKNGSDATVTVNAADPGNPIQNYAVNIPNVDPATAGDTSLSGNVAITEPVPDGTTFKAIATLPGGIDKEGTITVNGGTGTFTIDTGTLNADDVIAVKVQAMNGTNTKDGLPRSITVQAAQPTNPLDNYNVNAPSVNPAKAGDTTITGNANLNTPFPDGTTFKAIATLPGGVNKEAVVNSDGSYSIDSGTLTAGQIVSVKIQAVNGTNTKDSTATNITVSEAEPTNPIENYDVATPTLNPATAGDTSVSGNATLTTPIPDGTTFKAIATLPGGGTATSDVTMDGNHATFSVDTGELSEGQTVSVKLQAVNGDNTKDGSDATVTVDAADPENPIQNYAVNIPNVDTATAGDTSIAGNVTITEPIPDGTTFKAIATLPGGIDKEGTITINGGTGTFTIDTGTLNTDDVVSVKVQAANGTFTKDGLPRSITVQAAQPTNPLDDYNVNAPSVNQAKAGETAITGNANLNTPFPDETTFKAVATLPGGITKEAVVNSDGSYSIDSGSLTAGQDVSVKIQAVNGSNTKDSTATNMTVGEADPTNPLVDYNVATPMLATPKNGDTSVSGTAMLTTPVPEGTTFKAIATLPDGSTKTVDATVDGMNATFTADTGELTTGQVVSAKLQAINGDFTKDGDSSSVTVEANNPVNPLDGYTVNAPSVNPATAGDTTITGNANLNTPIPDGTTFKAIATLPGGDTKEAIVNPDGSYTIDSGELAANQQISVKIQAINGDHTKDSLPTGITVNEAQPTNPLENYDVATPILTTPKNGDTSVSGTAMLTTPVPEGTTFKAIATLPDGATKTVDATVNGMNATFTIDTGELSTGQVVSVKLQAVNGDNTKDGSPASTTVEANNPTNPLDGYTVNAPMVNPAKDGDTTVSGNANLNIPAPEGTTFTAIATLPDGSTKDATVNPDGSFTIDSGKLNAGEHISITIQAQNGDNTKDSLPTAITVNETEPTNPLDDYTVNAPSVNPAKAGETAITGNANLNTPFPDGTTFKAIATLPGGITKEAVVNSDGSYSIDSGTLTAGQEISVKIQAMNGDNVKNSTATNMTVDEADPTNPLVDYDVATPILSTPKNGDTSVSGSATLTTPVPEGTTFKAIATLPDGSTKTVDATVNGINATFTVDTGELNTGQVVSVKLQAVNGDFTKDGGSATTTVEANNPANPLDGYTVNAPSVNPAKAGETTVTGNANFNTPIPDGTTFKAIATMPDGSLKEANVNGDGSYSIDTGTLAAGQQITVKIQATNGDHMKDSLPTAITVNEADPTNPLDGYTVNVPTVDPAVEGNTTIDGNANLNTPFPEGTTFKAVATLPGGVVKEAGVNADGSFSIDSGKLTARDEISVKIVATNGENTKDSLPVTFFVGKSDPTEPTNPLDGYNVATPTLNPAKNGDTSVSGSASLSTPVPDGTTFKAIASLADGSTKTVNATVNGDTATFTVDTGELKTGQVISVKLQAVNGENTKDGSPASVTVEAGNPTEPTNPLDSYNVGTPTVNPAKGGDTTVTGNANITTPVPDGTTFTAVATLPDGSTKTGTVNPDGSFTIDTGVLAPGQTVTVKIIAKNGDNSKDSTPVSITVGQPSATNPLDDYTVGTPTVDPVKAGDKNVTGNANITTPVPDGTTFTAVVTLPDGSTKSAPVDANGHFTIPIDGLAAGQTITVKIVAKNGDNTKDSSPVNVTIGEGEPSNPSNPGNGGNGNNGGNTNNPGTGNNGGSGGTGTGNTGGSGSGNTNTGQTADNSSSTGSSSSTTGAGNTGTSGRSGTNTTGSTGTGSTGSTGTTTNGSSTRRSVTTGGLGQPRATAPRDTAATTQSSSQTTKQTQREKSGVLPLTDQQRATVASILGAGLLIGAIAAAYRFIRKR